MDFRWKRNKQHTHEYTERVHRKKIGERKKWSRWKNMNVRLGRVRGNLPKAKAASVSVAKQFIFRFSRMVVDETQKKIDTHRV